MDIHSLKNHLLVATHQVDDETFSQSVVYLCEHSDEGSMGLIINKPSNTQLDELLDHLSLDSKNCNALSQPIYKGGPIGHEHGFVLFSESPQGKINLSASKDLLRSIAEGQGPEDFLITLGYAGWEKDQLEQEIKDNDWLIVPANNQLMFKIPAPLRWQSAGALVGVDLTQMSAVTGHA